MAFILVNQPVTVHTTGVNWESVAVIVLSILGVIGAYSRWIITRLDGIRERVARIEIELARANGRPRRWWR